MQKFLKVIIYLHTTYFETVLQGLHTHDEKLKLLRLVKLFTVLLKLLKGNFLEVTMLQKINQPSLKSIHFGKILLRFLRGRIEIDILGV